jgi:GT2 family glycosyltransferase
LQLSIIIINYNVKYFLEQCLSSVVKALESVDSEIFVVDNASSDGSVAYLKPRFPSVNFIINNTNTGFGKANNKALAKCTGKYVLFLNPDTIVPEDCFIKCIRFMEENGDAGAVGVRMINGAGVFLPESKRSLPTPATAFYKLTGLSRLFPNSKIFSRYALGYLNEYENQPVDVLAGAFLLARKDLLVGLKGFDEAFFMYGEDIDLCFRIKKSGYTNYYFSQTTIIHFKGESTKKGSLNYVRMFYHAMSIFVKKHYSGTDAWFSTLLLHVAIWLRAGISAIAGGLRINKFFKSGLLKSKVTKTVLVGTEDEMDEAGRILLEAGRDVKMLERLAIMNQKNDWHGSIPDLTAFLNKYHADQIIFCCGSLSYQSVISIVQNLSNRAAFRFHGKGTKSIVGSDSKNREGDFVASASGKS